MSGPQPPTEDTSRWTLPDYCWHSRQSLADELRDALGAADLTIHVDLWRPNYDYFAKGAPWWQWRTPCDCPDTRFGRNPHRWNCSLTPLWAQTIRDLDTNPWTVIANAIRHIPQLDAWTRDRQGRDAILDHALAYASASLADTLGLLIGIGNAGDWSAFEAAQLRLEQAVHDAHPLTLTAHWGTTTELDYYGGDR